MQDRKRKRYIWDRVVKYIRESESRVREDVQAIYGEEHLVWQWIPDIHWSPMTHPGPNPYPYSTTPPHLQTSTPVPGSGGGLMSSPSNFHHPPSAGLTPHMPNNYKVRS